MRWLPTLSLISTLALTLLAPAGCDSDNSLDEDMGAALVGSWSATFVRGEKFPDETIVEIGGVEQGPQTRTRELILYDGGKGELLMETRFVSMLSKVENIDRTIYLARVVYDDDPEYTIRLSRDSDVVMLDCTLEEEKLKCTERDVEADPYGGYDGEVIEDPDKWRFKR